MTNIITNAIENGIILFATLQFINVIISTIKSVLTVNGSKITASLINAIAYTFYVVVVKMLSDQSFTVVIIVTFTTNIIGVYIAKWLVDKFGKERLWVIIATIKEEYREDIEVLLRHEKIGYTLIRAEHERYLCHIFAYSKDETKLATSILNKYENVLYNITENKTKLK